MKKQIFTILLIVISLFTFAQDNELDALFENQPNLNKEVVNVLESTYSQSWEVVTEEYLAPYFRVLYSYDDNANRTQVLLEIKDVEDNWIPYVKYNYFFTNNVRTNGIKQDWDTETEEYVNKRQYFYYYNDDGLLIDIQTYIWDLENLEWYLNRNDLGTYNEANELIERIQNTWDLELEEWRLSGKYVYEYEDGNKTRRTRYSRIDNEWRQGSKHEYFYLDNGLRSDDYYYTWDNDIETWITKRKQEYFHNDAGYVQYFLSYNWDEEIAEWTHTYRQTYNWMEINVGVNSLNNTLFSVKPNPVSDYLSIDSTTDSSLNISIYNSLGQLVLQNNTIQSSINVSALHKGVYFLKIIENNTNSLQLVQFIKE